MPIWIGIPTLVVSVAAPLAVAVALLSRAVATKLVVRPTSTAPLPRGTPLRSVRRLLGAAAAVFAGTVLLLRVLLDVVRRPPFKQ